MKTRPSIRTAVLQILIFPSLCSYATQGVADAGYEEFARLAREGKKAEALDLGGRLFEALVARNPDDAMLALLSKRLDAAQRIGTLIAGSVRRSQMELLEGVGGIDDPELAARASGNRGIVTTLPPPAQELYWMHLGTFTGDPALGGLPAHQAAFLGRYYDLRMQDAIVRIGRQVIVGDPNSLEDTCYAVVLPLLHLSGRDDVWSRMESFLALFSPRQLEVLWRFTLLQAERPQASIRIARYRARAAGEEFSLAAWAPVAADACVANHRPDLARQLLQTAMDGAKDRNQTAGLRLKIVEGYARCGDYATATQTCRQIIHDLPDVPVCGKAMAMYFGYLAREGKADQIVAETEPALQDVRCQPYLPQILYLRWWALCKTNRQDEAVRVAQRLIERYPRSPCVAPVLLERASDALARQRYDRCCTLLMKLTKDFPGTESAQRAEEILVHLQNSGILQGQEDPTRAGTRDRLKER